MARFILDVGNLTESEVSNVMSLIETNEFLLSKVTSIRCIDSTDNNQFYGWDSNTSPMMNALSDKQIERDREILSNY